MNIPKVLDSEEVYKGRIITVRKDTLTRGDGKTFVRETAVSADAVAVAALDEENRILLIRQYRHPMGQPVWEIPAGKMDVDGGNAGRDGDPGTAGRNRYYGGNALAPDRIL